MIDEWETDREGHLILRPLAAARVEAPPKLEPVVLVRLIYWRDEDIESRVPGGTLQLRVTPETAREWAAELLAVANKVAPTPPNPPNGQRPLN